MEIFRNLSGFILLFLFSISTIIGKGEHLPLKLQSESYSIASAETIQDDFFGKVGDKLNFNPQTNTFSKRVINHFAFSFLIKNIDFITPADLQPYDALYHIDVYKGSLSIFNLVLRI